MPQSNWWRDPAQSKPPSLLYRDPNANPVQDNMHQGFAASSPYNMFTGDPGSPQATDDPAYVNRRYNTMPSEGVHPYRGSNEDLMWKNIPQGAQALLSALNRYMGGDDWMKDDPAMQAGVERLQQQGPTSPPGDSTTPDDENLR